MKRKKRFKHGFARRGNLHPIYTIWAGMLQRCYDPAAISYQWYGGRGVEVCRRWHKFTNFKNDMFSSWRKGLTLERFNNEKNYCPSNCGWITLKEQQSHKSNTILLVHGGTCRTASEWSRLLGGTKSLVKDRLKNGWRVDEAVTMPADKRFNPKPIPILCPELKSIFASIKGAAKQLSICENSIRLSLERGDVVGRKSPGKIQLTFQYL